MSKELEHALSTIDRAISYIEGMKTMAAGIYLLAQDGRPTDEACAMYRHAADVLMWLRQQRADAEETQSARDIPEANTEITRIH